MSHTDTRPDLARIQEKVRRKAFDYSRYNFSQEYNDLLKAFFDLSQEYDYLPNFFRIAVTVPLEFLGVESDLYLLDESQESLQRVSSSVHGICHGKRAEPPSWIVVSHTPYATEKSYVVPVFGKAPREAKDADLVSPGIGDLLGMFEVSPLAGLSEADFFFFRKYANRIGFNLNNRLVSRQNISHLKFINTLILDIEHNVIAPNMYFTYLIGQLRQKTTELLEVAQQTQEREETSGNRFGAAAVRIGQEMARLASELKKHHENVSLFLESLFRREHFERGHLVLRPRLCKVEQEVVKPQLEQYAKRLEQSGITVEYPADMSDAELSLMVDKGLLAQVYANFFSNAVKYTREIIDDAGRPRKAVSYGWEMLHDYFGPSVDGVKFNVFTTGPHLTGEEKEKIFSEGFRGKNSEQQPGAGHGLAFVKQVIEVHGGQVGYQQTAQGNNFFFILPSPLSREHS